MAFLDSIKTCFRKYVDFSGRATRAEYWYFFLFTLLVGLVAGILDNVLGLTAQGATNGPISWVTSLALLLPGIAVAVRRLHDVNRSGWWVLLNLVPVIGSLFLIIAFYIKKSEAGANRFGPSPLAGTEPVDTGVAPAPTDGADEQLAGTHEA